MARIVKGSARINQSNVGKHLREFLNTQTLSKQVAERLGKMKADLMEYVEENGTEDEKGHQWLEVPGVGTIKRERRVSAQMDEAYTEEWLKKNKLYDRCTTTITVLDEDAIVAAIFDGTIPEGVAENIYVNKESFAFKVTEEK